jgi:tetratricopeptide (TPR) repeat protein
VARGNRCASGSPIPLLDHVPDRGLRADHPRRLRLPAALSTPQAHQELIDRLWDFDDPAGSEARFRSAAESAVGHDQVILLTQVARALGLQGKFEEGRGLLESLPPTSGPEARTRGLLEMGRIMNSKGAPDLARECFDAAFAMAAKHGFEHLAIDALHMQAILAPESEQEPLNRRALEMAATAVDPRARDWRASLLNNLGWAIFERGDYAEALTVFEDALAARIEQGKPANIQIARWCIGRTLRALGRLHEAFDVQRSLAAEHAAAGTSDPYVDEELAELEAALAAQRDLKAGSPPTQE